MQIMTSLIGVTTKRKKNQMEKTTIEVPQMTPAPNQPSQKILDDIELWNKQAKDGEWAYSQEFGLVWIPVCNDMRGGVPNTLTPPTPPSVVTELIAWGKTLDFESLKPNSVLVIKLNPNNPMAAARMQQGIVAIVLAPRNEVLKSKKITVLFMSFEDDISSLDEQEMEQAGWHKKEKSLIIKPY